MAVGILMRQSGDETTLEDEKMIVHGGDESNRRVIEGAGISRGWHRFLLSDVFRLISTVVARDHVVVCVETGAGFQE
jgi:hypothetical protein